MQKSTAFCRLCWHAGAAKEQVLIDHHLENTQGSVHVQPAFVAQAITLDKGFLIVAHGAIVDLDRKKSAVCSEPLSVVVKAGDVRAKTHCFTYF